MAHCQYRWWCQHRCSLTLTISRGVVILVATPSLLSLKDHIFNANNYATKENNIAEWFWGQRWAFPIYINIVGCERLLKSEENNLFVKKIGYLFCRSEKSA